VAGRFYSRGDLLEGVGLRGGGADRRPGELPCTPRAPARAIGRPDRWAPPVSVGGEGKEIPLRG
jgi:hypothetical protein